jgi:hypothetical protein
VGCFALGEAVFLLSAAVFISVRLIQLKQSSESIEHSQQAVTCPLIRLRVRSESLACSVATALWAVLRASEITERTGRRPVTIAFVSLISGRFLDSNLAQNSAQLVKIHRFGEMEIEAGLFAALDIFSSAKASQRYGFNGSFSLGLGNQVVAAPVR